MHLDKGLADHVCKAISNATSPYIVGICGWADTGKSTLAKNLSSAINEAGLRSEWISTDAFMKDREERNLLGITGYDLSAIDAEQLVNSIACFTAGVSFEYHPYDNKTGTKQVESTTIFPGQVLVVEGIHAFHSSVERALSLKVYLDADEQTLRDMRQSANIHKRGMSLNNATSKIQMEWDAFCSLVLPRRSVADMIFKVTRNYEYTRILKVPT
jgi:uridine kinase